MHEHKDMTITRELVANMLKDYLSHQVSLKELTHWAETAMMDAEFDENEIELLSDVVSKLGLADVRDFGLTWKDCEDYLIRLGYRAQVAVTPLA